jgi:hypothetical protein
MIEVDYLNNSLTRKKTGVSVTRDLKTKWSVDDELGWVYKFLKCFKADEKDLEKVKINYKRNIVKLFYKDNKHIRFEYFEDLTDWRVRQYKRLKAELR